MYLYSLQDKAPSWHSFVSYRNVRLQEYSRGHIYNRHHAYSLRDKTMYTEEAYASKVGCLD